MSKVTKLAEKIQNGELQDCDLESLTPEELEKLEQLSFDADEAANEITGGETVDEDDVDDGELVP